jgi:predicted hydrocarbon binding protein
MYNPSAFAMENSTDNTKIADMQHNVSPRHMGWVFQQAIEEILGQSGENIQQDLVKFSAQIKCNHSQHEFSNSGLIHISHLQAGLESAYGARAGHGLAVRIGRACLKYALREFGPELGLTELPFRLLPLQAKLTTATAAFAALFNTCTDQRVRLEKDEKYIYWIIERCPLCWESQAEGPGCYLAVGFLQEALFWASGGKNFEVAEKQCSTMDNGACIIQIDRIPMS